MKIGIDCRLWNESGVGRYIRNLVSAIDLSDKKNEYVLFMLSKDIHKKEVPARFKKVPADVKWHSLKEQFAMPSIFLKEHLDLLHIPYINAPIFYPKKFILTVHDLTPIKYPTPAASKLPQFLYWTKLFFYFLILFIGVRKAVKVISVSNSTKNDLTRIFKVNPNKIIVIYNFLNPNFKVSGKKKREESYILYVGNAYPHKNLTRLIKSYQTLSSKYKFVGKEAPELILVGKEDFFYRNLKLEVPSEIHNKVKFFGFVSEPELLRLYSNAALLVLPSLYEGFGYQILEAFTLGAVAVCSNISVYREIAGRSVIYFNPYDSFDMADKIYKVLNMSKVEKNNLIKASKDRISKFSWRVSVKSVLSLYELF